MGENLLPLLHERLTCVGILTLKTQFKVVEDLWTL